MVWGMIPHRALSDLHIIPQGQTTNAAYYCTNILDTTCKNAVSRKRKTGSTLQRAMNSNMSKIMFMQDGAPAHTAKVTQQKCSEIFPSFWKKVEWPGNSPDLNPIENLWSILSQHLDEIGTVATIQASENNLKIARASIHGDTLESLVSSMPNRMKLVIENAGGYIYK